MKKHTLLFAPVVLALAACSTSNSNPSSDKQWVYINNGGLQCQDNSKTPEQTAAMLSDQGIQVSESKCAELTNVMVATMCGAPGVDINLHQIEQSQTEQAKQLGYSPVAGLKQGNEMGYKVKACK